MSKEIDVLIVDDNEADTEILKRQLDKTTGFESKTTAVKSHEKTLKAIEDNDFDVIFMDYRLPDKNGLLTVTKIRNRDVSIPIIMLTGKGSERLAANSMREGADDYLSKKELTPASLQYSLVHVIREYKREKHKRQRLQELKKKSEVDDLTNLYNRRALKGRLREEIKRSQRYGSPLSLMMLDLDNFKEINDTRGHLVGDKVLEETSWKLLNMIRETDFLARYGGDEFCIIVTGSTVDDAVGLGERIINVMDKTNYKSIDETIDCAFSIGIAEYVDTSEDVSDQVQQLLNESDKAMYLAKELEQGGIFTVRKSDKSKSRDELIDQVQNQETDSV